MAISSDGSDHVVAFFDGPNEVRNLLGRILEIGIEGDHDVTASVAEAANDGRMLAVVTIQNDGTEVASVESGGGFKAVRRTIATSVIDEDDFPRVGEVFAGGNHSLEQRVEVLDFVVDRDNHGD